MDGDREKARTAVRRVRALGALLACLALLAAATVPAACGDGGSTAPADPFGEPPAPAPDIHAWAAGERGTVLVTTDGGATWKRQPFYLPQRGVDVAFPDARTGWLVTDAGTVLATTDGGTTWKVAEQAKMQVKALAAADATHAWLVGSGTGAGEEPGKAAVLRTTDGGVTWKRTAFRGAMLADVAFSDARHGVLVALDRIWTTGDGGRSWKLRRELPMTVLTSATAADARHAWVAGWRTQDGAPVFLSTADAGRTWREATVDTSGWPALELQVEQVACAGPERVWATCRAGIVATADAGRTWALQKVPYGQPLAVAAADEQHVLATTRTQPVLATADGGATWLAFGRGGFLAQPLVAVAAAKAAAGASPASPAAQ